MSAWGAPSPRSRPAGVEVSLDKADAVIEGLRLDWRYSSLCTYSSGADFHPLAMVMVSQFACRAASPAGRDRTAWLGQAPALHPIFGR